MKTIEATPGSLLAEVIEKACDLADGESVTFDFNDEEYTIQAGETYEQARIRIGAARGQPVLDREEMAEEARRSLEERKARQEAAIAESGVPTEAEMRDADVPWPESMEDLAAYINGLVDRPHDYGTCVYAMSMAAVAAFRHVAGKLGVSGFQASCADMDVLRRIRRIDGGFRIVVYDDLLYPQYWDDERRGIFAAELRDNPERYAEKARTLLREDSGTAAVRDHLRKIARADQAPEAVGVVP